MPWSFGEPANLVFILSVCCNAHVVMSLLLVPTVHVDPGPHRVEYGHDITLVCNLTYSPFFYNASWTQVQTGLITEYRTNVSQILFKISDATYEDSGQYTCNAASQYGSRQSQPVNISVYGDEKYPVVNIVSNHRVVPFGSSLTIKCSVYTNEQSSPVREIYWQFNNNGVITKIVKDTNGISGSSIETPSLTILEMTTSESGIYNCFAKNDIGTGQSKPINVTVTGGVPIVNVRDTIYSIGYGEKATLNCFITSNPSVTNVYWEKEVNGTKNILNNLTMGIQGVSRNDPSLVLMESTKSDIGTYRCVAINDVGTGKSETLSLMVVGVSVIAELPAVKYGDKVHIFCVVSSNPPSTKVYWEKKTNNITKKINKGTSGTDGITVTNPSLIILHATDSDSGLYRCFAVNVVGMGYSSSVNLDVIGGVPEVSVPSITHLTGAGYTVTLVCKVTNAFPEVFRVYWQRYLHGSITVISLASIGIKGVTVESPSLIIPSAMESMTGEYTCFAVNSVGTGSSLPATLTVKAGVPTVISGDSDDDQTDTVVQGIIGTVSALAGVGAVVIAVIAYMYTKNKDKLGLEQQSYVSESADTNPRYSKTDNQDVTNPANQPMQPNQK